MNADVAFPARKIPAMPALFRAVMNADVAFPDREISAVPALFRTAVNAASRIRRVCSSCELSRSVRFNYLPAPAVSLSSLRGLNCVLRLTAEARLY